MDGFDSSNSVTAHSPPSGADTPACGGKLAGYKMIHSVDIRNFRCFRSVEIPFCSRINVIVGDNGVGKTALLEAIFLALGVSSELGARFRMQRGLDAQMLSNPHAVDDAFFGDLFYRRDMSQIARIKLSGDGLENRSVEIKKQPQPLLVGAGVIAPFNVIGSSVVFEWTDSNGAIRQSRISISPEGQVQFSQTGENLPQYYYFSANSNVSSLENAMRFSALSQNNKEKSFIDAFRRQFDWIDNVSIEVSSGSPVLFATLKEQQHKVPVVNVSGAVNRIMGVLLGMASSATGAVLVDELENGIYHSHHQTMWRTILDFSRNFECQLFTTTHSSEWLSALIDTAGEDINDISLWRVVRGREQPVIKQFSGQTLRMGIESGGEVR